MHFEMPELFLNPKELEASQQQRSQASVLHSPSVSINAGWSLTSLRQTHVEKQWEETPLATVHGCRFHRARLGRPLTPRMRPHFSLKLLFKSKALHGDDPNRPAG